jgi:hypothetical protein
MVRPEYCAARPAAESTSLAIQVEDFYYGMLLTSQPLCLYQEWDQMEVQESENKLKIKPPSSFRRQQDLNHSPVDEEYAVHRLVKCNSGERSLRRL